MSPTAKTDRTGPRRGPPLVSPVLLALALAAPPAVGGSEQDKGWYLGSGDGLAPYPQAEARRPGEACVPLMRRCGASGSEWKLAAGYRFSPYFTAEFEYGDFNRRPGLDPLGLQPTGGSLVRGLNLNATAKWPVRKRLDVFGRVGTRQWDTPGRGALSSGLTDSGSKVTMQLGAGMSYDLSDRLDLRAEWERQQGILGGLGTEADEDVFKGYLRFRF